MNNDKILIACVSNNDKVLGNNLAKSPEIEGNKADFVVKKGFSSASRAFNEVLEKCQHDIVVFVHQDVYLPSGWLFRLRAYIDCLLERKVEWGVIGVAGMNESGDFCGHLWSSGLGRKIGEPFKGFLAVESLDEVLIILNNTRGLRFDSDMPGFHLYGTDISLTSAAKGLKNFAIDCPVIHNSKPVRNLDGGYVNCYKYICKKWKDRLPIKNCVLDINGDILDFYLRKIRIIKKNFLKKNIQSDLRPDVLSKELKYEYYSELNG